MTDSCDPERIFRFAPGADVVIPIRTSNPIRAREPIFIAFLFRNTGGRLANWPYSHPRRSGDTSTWLRLQTLTHPLPMSLPPDPDPDKNQPIRVVGRYAVFGKLATGGMATVHFGRLQGPVGFSRTVAIKCLHPQYAKDPEFVAMFLDEARVAARIQHPNVVSTLDIVSTDDELFLVMDYVRGESLSRLLRTAAKRRLALPEGFIPTVVAGMLHGLHAAHEATDERGEPLKVVHRDVSPQNVLVAIDGVPRILDFGVAKAAARAQVTRDGQMKGKLSYMSPEQLQGRPVDRRSDIFAAGVLLWESLTGERLFAGGEARDVLLKIIKQAAPAPSTLRPTLSREVDALVLRALQKEPDARFQTAREFAIAIEETMPLLSHREVGEWVEEIAGDSLGRREAALAEIEGISSVSELNILSPSDAGFAQDLAATPAESARSDPPPEADDSEVATAFYAGSASTGIAPAPQDDPTQVFEMDAASDLTSPRQSSKPPFLQAKSFNTYAIATAVFSGLLLLVAVLAGVFSEDAPSGSPAPARSPSAIDARSAQGVLAVKPPPAPKAPQEEAAPTLPFEQLPVAQPKSRPTKKAAPETQKKKTSDDCARPFYVDQAGIRRIKPACL